MKILLIAPYQPGLNTPLEIEQIGAGHQVVALTGIVDHDRLTRATATARFDAVHVASHCGNSQIELSNGQVLTRDQLSQMARKVRADLVFLNACDSANFAQFMVDTGVPVVLAWTIPVLDENGVRTAAYYYDELLHNHTDLHAAYRKINPQDGSFLFLAGQAYVESIINPIKESIKQLGQQINGLIQAMSSQRKALILFAILMLAGLLSLTALLFYPWSATGANPASLQVESEIVSSQIESPTAELMATLLTPAPEPPSPTPLPPPTEPSLPPTDLPIPATAPPTDTPAPTTTVGEPATPGSESTVTQIPTRLPTDLPITATLFPEIDTATPTDLPIISTPSATPNPGKPARQPTATDTRAPTWTPTLVVEPTQADLDPSTTPPISEPVGERAPKAPAPGREPPGCRASNGQPQKCDPTVAATATNTAPATANPVPGATNLPPTATTVIATPAPTRLDNATASPTLIAEETTAPLPTTPVWEQTPTPLPHATYDQSIFTPWPTPSLTPLGEPPGTPWVPPTLAPCFTSAPNQRE